LLRYIWERSKSAPKESAGFPHHAVDGGIHAADISHFRVPTSLKIDMTEQDKSRVRKMLELESFSAKPERGRPSDGGVGGWGLGVGGGGLGLG
jgi:hypothetical protein